MAAPSRVFLQEPVQAPGTPPPVQRTDSPADGQGAVRPVQQEPQRPTRALVPFEPGEAARVASTPYEDRGELVLDLYGERQTAEYERFKESLRGLRLPEEVVLAGLLSAREVYGLPGGDLEAAGAIREAMSPESQEAYDLLREGLKTSLKGLSGQVVPDKLQASVWEDPQARWKKLYGLYSRHHGDDGAMQVVYDILDAHVTPEERTEVYGRLAQAGTMIDLERGMLLFGEAMTKPEADFEGLMEMGSRKVLERGYVTDTRRIQYGPEPANIQTKRFEPEKPLDPGRQVLAMFLARQAVELGVQSGVKMEAPDDIPQTYGEALALLDYYRPLVKQALQVKWGQDALRKRQAGEAFRFQFTDAHIAMLGKGIAGEEGALKLEGDDKQKAQRLLEMFERIQRGDADAPVEMAGGIKIVNVLMDAILSGTRFMGTTTSVGTDKIQSPYIVTEVGVYDDWLSYMEDALDAYENDPYFVWEESADLVRSEHEARDIAAKQYATSGAGGALAGPMMMAMEEAKRAVSRNPVVWSDNAHPWKATMIPLDSIPGKSLPEALAEGVRGALYPDEGVYLMDALFQIYTAGENPTRPGLKGVANVMSVATDIVADPINLITLSPVTKVSRVAKAEAKLIKELEKEGFQLGAKAQRAGVRTLEEVAEDLRGFERRGPRGKMDVRLAKGGKLNPDLVPGYQMMHAMFGDDEVVQFIYEEVRRQGPRFLQKPLKALMDDPVFSTRLFNHMRSGGLAVKDQKDAVHVLYNLFPVLRKATGRTNLNALSKLVPWTRFSPPQIKAARGVYVGGTNLLSPVTDPIMRGLRAIGKGSQAMAESLGIWKPLSQGIREMRAWRDFQRSLVSFDSFSRVLASDVKVGRGRAPLTIPLDAPMANALRNRVMALGSREGVVEEMMTRWAMVLPEQAKEFGLKVKSVPENLAEDIVFMLDMGRAQGVADFERGVRDLALVRHIEEKHWKELSGKTRQAADALKAGDEEVFEALNKELHGRVDEIAENFYKNHPGKVDDLRRTMLPYRRNFDEARKVLDETGALLEEVGAIEKGLTVYFPHHLTGISREMLDSAIADPKVWDDIMARRGLKRIDTTGSMFNLHRKGPPTILEARLAGLDFSTDMYSVMKMRLQKAVDDIEDFRFMDALATNLGVERTWSRNAVRRLVSPDFNVQMDWLGRVDQLLAKADSWTAAQGKLKEMSKALNATENIGEYSRLKAAYDEEIARFAEAFEANFQEIKEMVEVGTQHGVLRGEIAHLQNALKKYGKEGTGEWDAMRVLSETENLEQMRQVLRTYDDIRKEFRNAGISQREETALLMEMYKVPTLTHLTPQQAEELLHNGRVELNRALSAEGQEIVFRDGYDAFRKAVEGYAKTREANKYFVQPFREGMTPLAGRLKDTWLPIEAVLLMREMGQKTGTALQFLDQAARKQGVSTFLHHGGKLLHALNRQFKERATVWNPALSFNRRNQLDAALKMYTYGGIAAFNPRHLNEFKAWATGKMTGDIIQANGGRVSAQEARDFAHRHLLQSYEHRFDVEGALARAQDAEDLLEVGSEVRKQTERAAKAMEPRVLKPGFRGASTGGRMPSLYDLVIGWGPQSTEVLDNTLRMWLFYNEVRLGKSMTEATANAGRWVRNYMNMSRQEREIISAYPALFYNFSKQNLIAVAKAVSEQPGRAAFWPKFVEWSNSEIPDELRPHWSNALDSILGRDQVVNMVLDMSGVEVLDAAVNYLLAAYQAKKGERPVGAILDYANKQAMDQAPPVFQQLFGGERTYINVKGWSGKWLLDTFGPGEITFAGIPVGRLGTTGTTNQARLELSEVAAIPLGLLGPALWANTLTRHGRRAWQQEWWKTMGEELGFFKLYDYETGELWFERGGADVAMDTVKKEFRDWTWQITEGEYGNYFWTNWSPNARAAFNAMLLSKSFNTFTEKAKEVRKAFQVHERRVVPHPGEEE